MTLYLKYRPQTIDELDSQTVRTQLKALVSANTLPHAFLFSGPRGTGKTSTARILAKIVNCEKNKDKLGEPCNECEYCLATTKGANFDVIEMDAASNRGIDDIRALKEKIILSPGSARKKIYIIDEVHMLTTEAFNALLKTLEEPPAHVLFILATTDAHKLPDTVRSRLTNITFEKATDDEIVRQLTRVSKAENLKVDDGVLLAIAKVADGSFRDAVKTLEQLVIHVKDLTLEKVEDYLFQNKLLSAAELLELIIAKKQKEALLAIEKFASQGGSVKNISTELIGLLHTNLLAKNGIGEKVKFDLSLEETGRLVDLVTRAKAEMAISPIAQLPLEMALVNFLAASKSENVIVKNVDSNNSKEVMEKETVKKDTLPTATIDQDDVKKKVAEPQKEQIDSEKQQDVQVKLDKIDDSTWFKLLQTVRSKSASIEGFLRAAKPFGVSENKLKIGVFYRFHKEQLETSANKITLEDCVSQIFGEPVRVELVLTERVDQPVRLAAVEPSLTQATEVNIIDAAKEIFGQ